MTIEILILNEKVAPFQTSENELVGETIKTVTDKDSVFLCAGQVLENGSSWTLQLKKVPRRLILVLVQRPLIYTLLGINGMPCPYTLYRKLAGYQIEQSTPAVEYGICKDCECEPGSLIRFNYPFLRCLQCKSVEVRQNGFCFRCHRRTKFQKVLNCPLCQNSMIKIPQLQDTVDTKYDFQKMCIICYEEHCQVMVVNFNSEGKVCHATCIECFIMHVQTSIPTQLKDRIFYFSR